MRKLVKIGLNTRFEVFLILPFRLQITFKKSTVSQKWISLARELRKRRICAGSDLCHSNSKHSWRSPIAFSTWQCSARYQLVWLERTSSHLPPRAHHDLYCWTALSRQESKFDCSFLLKSFLIYIKSCVQTCFDNTTFNQYFDTIDLFATYCSCHLRHIRHPERCRRG